MSLRKGGGDFYPCENQLADNLFLSDFRLVSALQPSITILSEQLYDLSVNLAKSNLVQLDEVVTSALNLVIVTMESMSREKFAEHFKEDLIRKWKQLTLVHESIQKIENLDRRIITQLVSSASKLIRNIQEATGSRDHLDEDIDQNQLTGNSMYYCYRRQTGIVSRPDAEALGWWVFNVAEWMGLSENEAQRDDLYDQAIKVGEQFEAITFQELSGLEERDLTNGEEELAKQIKAIIVALTSSDVGQSHFLTYRFMILYTRFLEYVLRSPNSEAEHSAFEYGTTASARYFAMGIADNAMRRENIDGLIGKVVFSLSNIVSLVDKLDRDTVPIRGGNNRLSSLNRLLGECQGQLEQDDVRSDSENFIYWLLSVGSRFHNVITSEGLREIYLEYKSLEINLINMFGEHEKEKDAQYGQHESSSP
ncbi:unnamed protein product [Calicophoron daubneyi]|uniref:Uncharacterized protein n=1 Tax=Calicophoron daubneyi TaxID=300641 RepID=A0AAV2TR40_CALDB